MQSKDYFNGEKKSRFDINNNTYLKEFLVKNPPDFRISNKCCMYAKKLVSKKYIKEHDTDLMIVGVRKAEGGIRATSYKNCYSINDGSADQYRPLFWFSNQDRKDYETMFEIQHSDCYTAYGLKRTGCVGCSYNIDFIEELDIIQKYEPKLYNAVWHIFGKSYEYTSKYRKFQKEMKNKKKEEKKQNS